MRLRFVSILPPGLPSFDVIVKKRYEGNEEVPVFVRHCFLIRCAHSDKNQSNAHGLSYILHDNPQTCVPARGRSYFLHGGTYKFSYCSCIVNVTIYSLPCHSKLYFHQTIYWSINLLIYLISVLSIKSMGEPIVLHCMDKTFFFYSVIQDWTK